MEKTRIMAISDIHGDSELVKKLANKAVKENVDTIILAGDLTWMETSTKNIIGPFIKANKQVLLLHGNHEGIGTLKMLTETYPNTKSIHGYSIKQNNLGIFGVGGADFGVEPMSEKDFREALERSHNYIIDMEKKILVTHMHPAGTSSEFSGFPGSKSIRKAIEKFQPDLALFGHIHEASGLHDQIGKTQLINISRKEVIFEI